MVVPVPVDVRVVWLLVLDTGAACGTSAAAGASVLKWEWSEVRNAKRPLAACGRVGMWGWQSHGSITEAEGSSVQLKK